VTTSAEPGCRKALGGDDGVVGTSVGRCGIWGAEGGRGDGARVASLAGQAVCLGERCDGRRWWRRIGEEFDGGRRR
jgi:hypothetical protein